MKRVIKENQLALSFMSGLVDQNLDLIKAVDSSRSLSKKYDNDAVTRSELVASQKSIQEVMAMLFDDQMFGIRDDEKYRYLDKDGRVPFGYLRRAGETEIPRLIKNLRRLQLTQFAETASSKKYGREVGFSLSWKNPMYKPTKDEKDRLSNFEVKLQSMLFFPPGALTPSLSKFIGTMYEDFFDLDDITIQIRRDATGYPIGLHIEDPTMWYPIIPRVKQYARHDQDILDDIGEEEGAQIEDPMYHYVMMKGEKRYMAATIDNIYKSHFFTRSDYQMWRRGYSIMEQAIRVTAIIMNAVTFNAANFSNNRTPAGFISLAGGYANPLMVEKLKKVLWAQMSGVANQKKIPIIGIPENGEAKWINIHSSNKEMEFYTGMTLFTSILFGLSGTNPNESGLASFQDALKGNRLNDDSKDGTWRQSRDNGLNTFLNHIEQTLNNPLSDGKNVFEQITEMTVKCAFKGIASEDITTKNTINKERIQIHQSINDIRQEEGLGKAKYMVGEENIYDLPAFANAIISGVIRQDIQTKQQMEMQKAQMEAQQSQEGGTPPEAEGETTDRDRELLSKYGKPQQEDDNGSEQRRR